MNRILTTRRLTLRPLAFSDRDALVKTVMSDMDVMRWLPQSDAVSSPQGRKAVAQGYLEDFIRPWETLGYGIWAVCERKGDGPGDFLGYCGFLPEKIAGAGPEIAYALGKAAWGTGVISEALGACLDWIFMKPGILRVHAVTDTTNKASRKVMEKAGMKQTRDVDLYDSVARGEGLLPFYALEKTDYIGRPGRRGE